jgi:hypothetical protein
MLAGLLLSWARGARSPRRAGEPPCATLLQPNDSRVAAAGSETHLSSLILFVAFPISYSSDRSRTLSCVYTYIYIYIYV